MCTELANSHHTEGNTIHGSLYSVDWTTGLEYWIGLLDWFCTCAFRNTWYDVIHVQRVAIQPELRVAPAELVVVRCVH